MISREWAADAIDKGSGQWNRGNIHWRRAIYLSDEFKVIGDVCYAIKYKEDLDIILSLGKEVY